MNEDNAARSDDPPTSLLWVEAGSGAPLTGTTGETTIMARSPWSGDHALIFDQVLAPQCLMGAHVHTDETQAAYVVSGTIGFWVDGKEVVASAGDYVVRPAGLIHAMWNPTDTEARMLEITTPGKRYQEFMVEFQRLRDVGEATGTVLVAHAAKYGMYLHDDVTAELGARLGLGGSEVGIGR